jgi:hypothetical protein
VGEKRNAYGILVGKAGEERPLRRPKRGWVDNIKRIFGFTRTTQLDEVILTSGKTGLYR